MTRRGSCARSLGVWRIMKLQQEMQSTWTMSFTLSQPKPSSRLSKKSKASKPWVVVVLVSLVESEL
jgi:hypothetical protein